MKIVEHTINITLQHYDRPAHHSHKTVEHTTNITLQHYERPAHHSHKTIAAYVDENGYSSSC
jgi:hypothetical protein